MTPPRPVGGAVPRPPLSALARLVLPLVLLSSLCGCGETPERDLVRLTDLAAAGPAAEPVRLAEGIRVGTEPYHLDTDLPAARLGRLTLRIRGRAPSVEVHWKLSSERRFQPFRKLSVPLAAEAPNERSGEPRLYQVDLSREPYWVGTIDALRLSVPRGSIEVVEVTAGPEGAGGRATSLGGVALPTLPGLTRLELELPPDAPREATFEVHLGLAPQFDRPGARARFRAWGLPEGTSLEEVKAELGRSESGEHPEGAAPDGAEGGPLWLERQLVGDHERAWERVTTRVRVPAGGRVVLEVEAERDGRPLPEGAAIWGAPVLVAPDPPEAEDPHLVFVLVDTLRSDTVGAWGSEDDLTPHLDRLAAGSVRLDQLHAPTSWTLPSVTSLLTGLQPQSHDTGRTLGPGMAPTALGSGPVTLPAVLAEQGFYSVGVYNNIFLGPSFGVSRGFDLYDWVELEDDVLVDRAIELLERYHEDRRLFLFVHLFGPHNPYAPPGDACEVAQRLEPEYWAGSDRTGPAEPVSDPAEAGNMGCRGDRRPGTVIPPPVDRPWFDALYKAEVAFTDRQVGRLLEALERLGLRERVVLVALSDHGEDVWGRVEQLEAQGYTDSDHGHTHFQELVRVPGMIRAPGLEPGVVEEPVEMVDLFPTVLHLLGLKRLLERQPDAGEGGGEGREVDPTAARLALLQGRDLTPLLAPGGAAEGASRQSRRDLSRRVLLSDFMLYGERRWSARKGPWKLVVPVGWKGPGSEPPEGRPAPELYHLGDDPGEVADVYARHPEVVESLWREARRERARREELRQRLNAGDGLHAAQLQWNHVTKLRALGYLQ